MGMARSRVLHMVGRSHLVPSALQIVPIPSHTATVVESTVTDEHYNHVQLHVHDSTYIEPASEGRLPEIRYHVPRISAVYRALFTVYMIDYVRYVTHSQCRKYDKIGLHGDHYHP